MINITKDDLYPLLFEPAYKQVFWGGEKFRSVLKRPLPEDLPPLGEAWDICDRPNFSSPVLNGPLAGSTLRELLEHFGGDLVGGNYHGGPFPVIVKIVDARQRLSMQVHPTEDFCSTHEFCESKTEMWYVLQADKDAQIYAGLSSTATRQSFLSTLRDPEVESQLQQFDSIAGDAYFLPAGRIHFLGAGNLVLEISQNSDTSFRISDWGRTDENGEKRELNTREAITCMEFIDRTVPRICGASDVTEHNRKYPIINRCPYFHCDELILVSDLRDSTASSGSFHILTAVNGSFEVSNRKTAVRVDYGSSVLIPACFGDYRIAIEEGKNVNIIRTTL